MRVNPAVFFVSAGLIFAFIIFGSVWPQVAESLFGTVQLFITHRVGWLYNASATFFIGFCLVVAVSRYGRIRLGPDEGRPDYGRFTWFAMLFSAGMGIGVLFWSVAEPMTHFLDPPAGVAGTPAAARFALNITLWHWGLHGWAVYVVMGLALGYFAYRRRMPLTIRTVLAPLLGRRIEGALGDAVDIFSVLGTMFGVATSLGLGAQQVNAGLQHLAGFEIDAGTQLWLIAGITAIATASVVSGLNRGIRRLSELNIWLALLLFVYVLLAGSTGPAVRAAVVGTGSYLVSLFTHGFWADFGGDLQWQGDWTLFYWGWWIAWSPFVGMFVARISRGRTIREFVLGVLLVPTLMTCVWFATFGGSALYGALAGETELAQAVKTSVPVAIYVFFEGLPLSSVLAVVGTAVVVFFFVTSSDSASLVIDYLTAGGDLNPPKRQRVFWATTEGLVAAILLLTGGLAPMRTFQLSTGLPLCVILLLTCFTLVRALRRDPAMRGEKR